MHNGIFFSFLLVYQMFLLHGSAQTNLLSSLLLFFLFFVFVFFFIIIAVLDFFLEMLFCSSFFLVGCVGVCVCVLRRNLNRVVCIYISKSDTFMFYTMLCMYLGDCFMILSRLSLANYGKKMNHG